jgi:putative transcription antitermination factor YqgF
MRVLAVDYGRARTGLAVSDETGVLARPVGVVERVRSEAGMGRMLEQIAELGPDRIVVGMPLTLRGEHGRQAAETLDFIHELEARCPIPIETYDERFTTAMAARTGTAGSRPDDAVAAAHLLEGYLHRLAGSSSSSS